MSAFERYLSIWVALAILAGLALGQIAPGLVDFLASLEYGSVNFVVAILIGFMVYPMMVALDLQSYGIFVIAYWAAKAWRVPHNVGVLVEVPVMLSLVWFANRTAHWFPAEETAIRKSKTETI